MRLETYLRPLPAFSLPPASSSHRRRQPPINLLNGPVTSVSSGSFKMALMQGLGAGRQCRPPSPVHLHRQRPTRPPSSPSRRSSSRSPDLPFTPTFTAANLTAGPIRRRRRLLRPPGKLTATASNVTLIPQTLGGTVTAITTSRRLDGLHPVAAQRLGLRLAQRRVHHHRLHQRQHRSAAAVSYRCSTGHRGRQRGPLQRPGLLDRRRHLRHGGRLLARRPAGNLTPKSRGARMSTLSHCDEREVTGVHLFLRQHNPFCCPRQAKPVT